MYGIFDLIDKIKRYFKFSRSELVSFVITVLCLTFIIGFNDKSDTTTIGAFWFYNMFVSLLVVGITVFVHIAGQRIIGLQNGYRVEYKMWWFGLILGIVIALVSRGNVWFILPGGIYLHHLAIHRLGYFRYGTNTLSLAMTALAGSIANILLATFVKTLEVWFGLPVSTSLFLNKLIIFNWVYALFTLLPIPPLDGALILFRSRLTFAFIFGCIAGYAILILFGIYSFLLALVIGTLFWLLYYLLFEQKAWDLSKL